MLNKGGYVLVGLLILNPAIILAYQSINGPVHIDTSGYAIHERYPSNNPSRSIASIPKPVVEKESSKESNDDRTPCAIEK